jgi:hypothetical protein
MKWAEREFSKKTLFILTYYISGWVWPVLLLSFVGYEWNGMDREEGCMHHIIQKRKMERSFVALAIPCLFVWRLGSEIHYSSLFWNEETGGRCLYLYLYTLDGVGKFDC